MPASLAVASIPRPGEVSLAHNGLLFLDELPEFPRNVLEVLRQPLEDHTVTIARASMSLTFPARFMLAAAMNPCPCGYFNDKSRECHVHAAHDPALHLPRSPARSSTASTSTSRFPPFNIRSCADRQRTKALRRSAPACSPPATASTSLRLPHKATAKKSTRNAQMTTRRFAPTASSAADAERLLERAMQQQGLTARAHDRILKVARTIADLEGSESLTVGHLAEAIQYRTLDRSYWA